MNLQNTSEGVSQILEEGKMLKLKVSRGEKGIRLDLFLSRKLPKSISRNMIQKAIKEGKVKVNGSVVKPSYRLKGGEEIILEVPTKEKPEILPENIPLDVIYEDKDIIVINKEAGMIVHPLPSKTSGTIVNAILALCDDLQGIGGVLRPGIVHRLDKETSGVMVIAKNDLSHNFLSLQFKNREVKKRYLAIVGGCVNKDYGVIDSPIGRHPQIRIKMALLDWGKSAVTEFRVLRRFGKIATLVEAKPKTGRTHQIRLHMKSIGNPILGDKLYGKGVKDAIFGANRQMLHALSIEFKHPRTGKYMRFNAPLPDDFKKVLLNLAELEKKEGDGDET